MRTMTKGQRYTLDRIDDGFCVFLYYENEQKELVIPVTELSAELTEGDVVELFIEDAHYKVRILQEETEDLQKKVENLLEKLKNKK